MRKLLYHLILTTFILIYPGCSDFLEKDPKGTYGLTNFFSGQQSVESALTAVYDPISKRATWDRMMFAYGDAVSDDTEGGGGSLETFNGSPTNPDLNDTWVWLYEGINRANLIIEKVPLVPASELKASLGARYVAEAKVFRAWYYFTLVNLFGGVPLITVYPEASQLQVPRSTREEVYSQIERDLTEAVADLPLQYDASNIGRVTKGTANAILAKLYLYQQKWQQAADKAAEVINSKVYDLNPNFLTNFLLEGENSIESIFEVQNRGINGSWGTDENEGNERTIWFSPGCAPWGGWGDALPTENLYQAFDENDPRKKYSIMSDGDIVFDIPYSANCSRTFHNSRKNLMAPKDRPNSHDADLNFMIIRFADVLLIHAEALTEAGNIPAAEISLNRVLKRARESVNPPSTEPKDVTGLSQSAMREEVRRQRRLELAMEGQRFFDLVRWGIAADILGSEGFVKGKHEIFPIPQAQIDLSGGTLTQNPGY
jgi:hypothetical protein